MISDNNHAFSTFNTSGWVRLKEFQALHSLVLEPQPCFDPAHLMASWNSAEEGIRWHIKGDRKGHLDSKELEGRLSIAIMSEEDMICRAEKLKASSSCGRKLLLLQKKLMGGANLSVHQLFNYHQDLKVRCAMRDHISRAQNLDSPPGKLCWTTRIHQAIKYYQQQQNQKV